MRTGLLLKEILSEVLRILRNKVHKMKEARAIALA